MLFTQTLFLATTTKHISLTSKYRTNQICWTFVLDQCFFDRC